MRIILIDRNIDAIIKDFKEEILRLKLAEDLEGMKAIKEKLDCTIQYKQLVSKRDNFYKIKHLRLKRPNSFVKKCQELVKDIKGIDFDVSKGSFRVRVRYNGKQMYLGNVDELSEAETMLKSWTDDK